MQLNVTTTLPSGPNTTYTITRPAGCTPPTTTTNTDTFSLAEFDSGTLTVAPKSTSLRVVPVPAAGGHVGIAFNCFGNQPNTPDVFNGVNFWTHANGIYFDSSGVIFAEVWHIDPGTTESQWFDTLAIGKWTAGRTYQVDITLSQGSEWAVSVRDMAYSLDWAGQPNNNAMNQFFSTAASAASPVPAERVRAKSVKGRTSRICAFIAGTGSVINVTPIATYN